MPPPFNVLRLICKTMNSEAYMQDDDGFSHLDDAIYRISTYYTLLGGFDSTELACERVHQERSFNNPL